MKLLTIAIPTYNRSEYLKACLDSLSVNLSKFSEQQLMQIEIIITDNNSTDNTNDIVMDYISLNPSIDIIYHKHTKNFGMVGNWNSFIKFSSGKYIIWFPDDDILDNNGHLTKAFEIISNYGDVQFVFGHHFRGYSEKNKLEIKNLSEYRYVMPEIVDNSFIIKHFWRGFYPHYAVFNRQDILDVGGFPESVALDMELIFKLMIKNPNKKSYYTQEAGAIWRLHSQSESEMFPKDKSKNITFIESMQRVYEFAEINNYKDFSLLKENLIIMCLDYILNLSKIDRSNLFLLNYAAKKVTFDSHIKYDFYKYIGKKAINKILKVLKLQKNLKFEKQNNNIVINFEVA